MTLPFSVKLDNNVITKIVHIINGFEIQNNFSDGVTFKHLQNSDSLIKLQQIKPKFIFICN